MNPNINNNVNQKPNSYKLLLVGTRASGKTSFLRRLEYGIVDIPYVPTKYINVRSLDIVTTSGQFELGTWEINFNLDRLYRGADCAIIMFDLSHKSSYDDIYYYYNELRSVNADVPIIVVGNKLDVPYSEVGVDVIPTIDIIRNLYSTHLIHNADFDNVLSNNYCEVSTKDGRNIDKPISIMLRLLTKTDIKLIREID